MSAFQAWPRPRRRRPSVVRQVFASQVPAFPRPPLFRAARPRCRRALAQYLGCPVRAGRTPIPSGTANRSSAAPLGPPDRVGDFGQSCPPRTPLALKGAETAGNRVRARNIRGPGSPPDTSGIPRPASQEALKHGGDIENPSNAAPYGQSVPDACLCSERRPSSGSWSPGRPCQPRLSTPPSTLPPNSRNRGDFCLTSRYPLGLHVLASGSGKDCPIDPRDHPVAHRDRSVCGGRFGIRRPEGHPLSRGGGR